MRAARRRRSEAGIPAPRIERYDALLAGLCGEGGTGVLQLVVDDPRSAAAPGTWEALGAAAALTAAGWGATLVRARPWVPPAEPVDAVISLCPYLDLRPLPGDVPAVAWVVDRLDQWVSSWQLPLYDRVLVADERALAPLAELHPRVSVAGIGVDADLGAAQGPAAGIVVVGDSRTTALGDALAGLGGDVVDLRRIGGPQPAQRAAPSRLLASLAGASAVVADVPPGDRARGLVPAVCRDAAAAGIPTLVRDAGAGSGDDGVSGWSTEAELAEALGRLAVGTPRPPAAQREPSWATAAAGLAEQVREARRTSAAVPTIGVLPDYSQANPYQALLYAGVRDRGVRLLRLPSDVDRLWPRGPRSATPYLLHVHWTSPVLQVATSTSEALQRLDAVTDGLAALRADGAQVVWTVHNVLPHECRFFDLEVELARRLASTADLIHVMDATTLDDVVPYYDLDPAKVVVIPHSSYLGCYPDTIGRAEARARLGVPDGCVALLVLGGIRPYKGLPLLLDVVDDLAGEGLDLRLLVAGPLGRMPEGDRTVDRLAAHSRVTMHPEFVPAEDVQVWARAADLGLLPYDAILNSGSLMLQLGFGLPVVAIDAGSVGRMADPAWSRTFTPGSRDSLRAAVADAVRHLLTPEAREAAAAAARARPPEAMSEAFVRALSDRFPAWERVLAGGAG